MRPDKIARPENISYKDKWCPFTRNRTVGWGERNLALAGVNRDDEDENPSWARCIGPRCMMFRGDAFGYNHNNDRTEPEHHPEYCGLVGKHPHT
jgi:hypothetical protein